MNLFDVYPLIPVTLVKADGCRLWDEQGQEYLDLWKTSVQGRLGKELGILI
jgi:acetylornithine/succinyldiaminopimelate/putrescine aminotransferase